SDLRQSVGSEVDESRHNFRDKNEEVNQTTSSIVRGGVVLSFIALGLALLIALLTTRSIVRPLRRLQAGADAIAQGSLEHHIEIHSRDEIGTLAEAFNNMSRKLKQ